MATLFSRKVFKTGRAGLAIYLPAPWTKYNGIRAGDALEVKAGNNLTVKIAKRKDKEKEITEK